RLVVLQALAVDRVSQASGKISVLIVPSLLSVILPFTLFVSALYTVQRLHADSEIAVMFAAGVSRMRIAAPLLLLAAIAAIATLWINVDLMPRSYRSLKTQIAALRADAASAVLRGGEFKEAASGMTIYVEKNEPGGVMSGLIINDYRDTARPSLYMAQLGRITDTDRGTVLQLLNGNVQRRSSETGQLEILSFSAININLDQYRRNADGMQLELTERYLGELFRPDLSRDWDRKNVRALAAEGHSRLAAPLYVFAYVLIALHALTGGPYNRRTYAARLFGACVVAAALRIGGVLLQNVGAGAAPYWTHYALPAAAIVVAGALVAGVGGRAQPGRSA
ncbi:MAG: LptF/LptG family permease, partial [Parvularculaceae bacterium]|nr:LptF/LptG family permease [Parvularculaceae bacterium]